MEENKIKLQLIAEQIQEERRRYNNLLHKAVKKEIEVYNTEDLFRIVGELNCAYNHCVASIAGDGDIYCLLKHLATAVILAGEVDGEGEALYQIVDTLTDGVVAPCKACHDEESDNKTKEE